MLQKERKKERQKYIYLLIQLSNRNGVCSRYHGETHKQRSQPQQQVQLNYLSFRLTQAVAYQTAA